MEDDRVYLIVTSRKGNMMYASFKFLSNGESELKFADGNVYPKFVESLSLAMFIVSDAYASDAPVEAYKKVAHND